MRALTIKQPWCWAILHGEKPVENRKKPPPKGMIGETFCIHAAKNYYSSDADAYERITGRRPPSALPCTVLIATAKLAGSFKYGEEPSMEFNLPKNWRDWAGGPYCWVFKDVAPSPLGIPLTGQLGFWTLPKDVEAEVLKWMKTPLKTRWKLLLEDEKS